MKHCMKNIPALIVFMGLAISVYDCGYKGPLYLPKKPEASKPVSSKPVASSAWTIKSTNESSVKKTNESSNLTKNVTTQM